MRFPYSKVHVVNNTPKHAWTLTMHGLLLLVFETGLLLLVIRHMHVHSAPLAWGNATERIETRKPDDPAHHKHVFGPFRQS